MKRIRRFSKRTWVLMGVVAVIAAMASVGAYAYWTSSGNGDGTASTGDTTSLTVAPDAYGGSDLVPGGSAQELTGTVTNPDAAAVQLHQIVATLQTPTGGSDLPNACTTGDYRLSDGGAGWVISNTVTTGDTATLTIDTELVGSPGPGNSYDWDQLGVAMFDKLPVNVPANNQDGCKDAIVHIHYEAS